MLKQSADFIQEAAGMNRQALSLKHSDRMTGWFLCLGTLIGLGPARSPLDCLHHVPEQELHRMQVRTAMSRYYIALTIVEMTRRSLD